MALVWIFASSAWGVPFYVELVLSLLPPPVTYRPGPHSDDEEKRWGGVYSLKAAKAKAGPGALSTNDEKLGAAMLLKGNAFGLLHELHPVPCPREVLPGGSARHFLTGQLSFWGENW